MKNIGWNNDFISTQKSEYDEPVYSPDELTGVVPVDYKTPYDCREVIARIVDGSDFLEFKEGWGKTLITGHATIQGYKVGILGNNGPIFSESANKATQFIQICSQSNTPLIFLQNITGFMVGTKEEAKGMIRHGSKMIQAVTNCTVPKICLLYTSPSPRDTPQSRIPSSA